MNHYKIKQQNDNITVIRDCDDFIVFSGYDTEEAKQALAGFQVIENMLTEEKSFLDKANQQEVQGYRDLSYELAHVC